MREPLRRLLAKGLTGFRGMAHSEDRFDRLGVGSSDDTFDGLLYARGFLLCRSSPVPNVVSAWARYGVAGDWTLHVDPRVPVSHAASKSEEVWLVGDAFHVSSGTFTNVADWLLRGDLLTKLDGMGGRFLLVHRQRGQVDIYNDALGSRSIFYGPGVVASHSELAARVIGAGFRDWIIPFITSRGYLQRDVKYLPGLYSPFEEVEQLTPNCRLRLGSLRPVRYWPRATLAETDRDRALDALVNHLSGLRNYFSENGLSPIVGLSAGRDSRGIIAALADQRPAVFTFVRSRGGLSRNSADSKIAGQLADRLGLELDIIQLKAPPPLDDLMTPFASAFRRNTGCVRGNNSAWVEQSVGKHSTRVFVRGFGGEVMRGFYQELHAISPPALSQLYDVNAGSRTSREAFAHFIDRAGWTQERLFNHSLSGLFYWEHRMGTWGASALLESDMAFRSIPGYNSRELFDIFAGLHPDVDRRELFEAAVKRLRPNLASIPYSS